MKASERPPARYVDQKYLVDSTFVYNDLLFDHVYRADSAIVYNGSTAIADSQRVGIIPDLVGDADMQYAGNNVLPLPGSYPMYFQPFSGKEGYVFFDNVPDKKFSTINQLNPVMTGKRELWLVMRRAGKAGNYDAYLSAWKSGYFSDKGQEKVSLSSNTSLASVNGNVPIPYNTKTLVRIKLNGDSSEVFIDNTRVTGSQPGGYFKEGDNDEWRYLVIGSEANGAYWDWHASYYKQGNFTPAQASVVYNSLSTRHEIGSLPALPYADSVRVVRNGDTYSIDYKFKNPLGYPEDTARTKYQFIYGGRGSGPQVQEAVYIDSLSNKKSFNRKDYALGNTKGNPELFSHIGPYGWFRMTVQVYDTLGNSWRFQTAEWKIDNEYATTTFRDADYFDHKYLADSAFVYQGSARVGNGQRAGIIPDLIGHADMEYKGDNVAPLPGSEPRYFLPQGNRNGQPVQDKEGYIFFDNVADEKFLTSNPLASAMTGKRELWLVMRRPGLAAEHEAYLNDWNAGYFSDRGNDRVGLSNEGDYNMSLDGSKPIPLLQKTLIRIKLNGDFSEVFINNNRVQGKHPGGYFSEGGNGSWQNLVIGAVSNNAYWDWYASYYKRGNFTDAQAQEVYTALVSRHETRLVLDSTVADKSLPVMPYASDIKVVRNGDTYTVDYKFNNPLGYPEDTNRTEYQFIYAGRDGGPYIKDAGYIDSLANKKSFNRKDYALGNTKGNPELFSHIGPYGWFRMTVKVYDTQGNSWRFQTTPWKIDNEYETTTFRDADYFDHKYLADSAFVYQGSARIENGQRAGNIPDLIGNADMEYKGDNVAPLPGSEPRYFLPRFFRGWQWVNDKEGYIFFDNVADENFLTSNPLDSAMTGKRELWLVMRRPGLAAENEAYLNGLNAGYFSDRGGEKVGLSNSDATAISLNSQAPIPLLQKTLIRIKLNGDFSEVFINNNRVQGPLSGGYFSEGNNAQWQNLVIGSDTTNAYWDWYASYYKRGNFTAAQVQEVYTALVSRHETKLFVNSTVPDKSLPALPYADSVRVVRNGDTYSVDYKFKNPLGYPEDTNKTEIQFIYGGRGTGPQVQDAVYIDSLANKKSFNRMHYAVGNTLGNPELFSSQSPYGWFRITVKVYDTKGSSWHFQTTPWKIDNEYPAPRIAVSGKAETAAQAAKSQVLPVPFQNEFSVQLEALQAGETEIVLLDLSGKAVHRQTFPVNKGPNTLTVQPRSSLPRGMYIIQFQNNGEILSVKTLKN